ncbi:MAG: sulfurtransferase TusA family protein [Mediterranea sp.]|jgi:TusA-related sulfurtransferase|nr:sulfurtransferase TusA family protein [Mediterranea sp.]
MKTLDTCGMTNYSPLIPAMKLICESPPGEEIVITMNQGEAFRDLKEYLAEEGIGFREIYDGEEMTLQFTVK